MHWYDKDGNPAYEVDRADGKGKRDTTLRDARKYGYVPSVTTILQVSAKPQLDRWKIEQALLYAEMHKFDGEGPWKDYLSEVMYESLEKSRKAANRGSELHDKLEQAYLGHPIDEEDKDFILPVMEVVHKEIVEQFPEREFMLPETSFSNNVLGFGGKVDLHSKNFILDFKTKDLDGFGKCLAYDEHCMQLAAYREGLKHLTNKNPRCYNVFISTRHPGLIHILEWTQKELDRGWNMFYNLLEYWKLLNNFEVQTNED